MCEWAPREPYTLAAMPPIRRGPGGFGGSPLRAWLRAGQCSSDRHPGYSTSDCDAISVIGIGHHGTTRISRWTPRQRLLDLRRIAPGVFFLTLADLAFDDQAG